jgi:hypothetical protein|tara:strand:- start:1746 stop:2342 length:597 start_codon:yes stop_codon:yes gene_type:complete
VKSRQLNIAFLLITAIIFAQKADTLTVKEESTLLIKDTLTPTIQYDPLAPQRAAFYSAVIPGLGQAYNKKYWKIPIIYAGIGTGVYFYLQNDQDYDRFRNAYKRRLAGFTDDEFYGDNTDPIISNQRLIDAQKTAQKNKDVSIIVSLVFYLLNIIDANVDSHFRQFNVSNDLSLKPKLNFNPVNAQSNYGLSFTYRIK